MKKGANMQTWQYSYTFLITAPVRLTVRKRSLFVGQSHLHMSMCFGVAPTHKVPAVKKSGIPVNFSSNTKKHNVKQAAEFEILFHTFSRVYTFVFVFK